MKPEGSNRDLLQEIGRLMASDLSDSENDEEMALVRELRGHSPGTYLGSFRLIRRMGEGGFAEVFEAQQEDPVKRRVALKILKTARLTEEGVARFHVERQALAIMEHPNIATIHDAGSTSQGQPFFAMEYVEGIPITEYCRQHALSVSERISLLILVADAVQHAHQKGIIHRDLKPSNILIVHHQDRPEPKVIDFGVAKAIESQEADNGLTREHQVLGTLAYMSPEQLEGRHNQIDTRTDVYGLGVLGYEILTGTTPYALKTEGITSYLETLQQVQQAEPVLPSKRAPESDRSQLKRDLDWVIMKALAKESDNRYVSAAAFAQDLRSYQNHEPVTAAAPSASYRLRKYVRRHRAMLAGVAAVLLACLGGSILSLNQAKRARLAEREAIENAKVANAVKEFMIEDFLDGGMNHESNPDIAFREVIDRAAERLEDRFRDEPTLRLSTHWMLSRIYDDLYDSEKALRHLDALASLRSGPDAPYYLPSDRIKYYFLRGKTLDELGDFEEAERLLLATETMTPERGPRGEEGRLVKLRSKAHLAYCYLRRGRYDESERLAKEVIAVEVPDRPGWASVHLRASIHLLHAHAARKDYQKAKEVYDAAINFARDRKFEAAIRSVELAWSQFATDLGQFAESEKSLLDLLKRHDESDKLDRMMIHGELAYQYRQQALYDKARPHVDTVLTKTSKWWPEHPARFIAFRLLAACQEAEGDLAGAEASWQSSIAGQRTPAANPVGVIETARELGNFYLRQGRIPDAVQVFKEHVERLPNTGVLQDELEWSMQLEAATPIVPVGQFAKVPWRVIESPPADRWFSPKYDDGPWRVAYPALRTIADSVNSYNRTRSPWKGSQIWMRHTFTLEAMPSESLWLHLAHDDEVDVYINGIQALSKKTASGRYRFFPLTPEARASLRIGENLIAVTCKNTKGGKFIDAGLTEMPTTVFESLAQTFTTLSQSHPLSAELHSKRALWLHQAGKEEAAFGAIQHALDLDPGADLAFLSEASLAFQNRVRRFQFERDDPREDALAEATWSPESTRTLVKRGATWHYHDRGIDLGKDWYKGAHTHWPTGPAPLGYGESAAITEVSDGGDPENRQPTTYFQHPFKVDHTGAFSELKLRLRFDDGIALYLNGEELTRLHLGPEAAYASLSTSNVGGDDERRYRVFLVDPALLAEGTNILSAEVHQDSATSSDVIFDLALEARLR